MNFATTFTCPLCKGKDKSIFGSSYYKGKRICSECTKNLKENKK